MTKKQAANFLREVSDLPMLLSETAYFVYIRLDPPPLVDQLRKAGFRFVEPKRKPGEDN